jgi:hypothetical protein
LPRIVARRAHEQLLRSGIDRNRDAQRRQRHAATVALHGQAYRRRAVEHDAQVNEPWLQGFDSLARQLLTLALTLNVGQSLCVLEQGPGAGGLALPLVAIGQP